MVRFLRRLALLMVGVAIGVALAIAVWVRLDRSRERERLEQRLNGEPPILPPWLAVTPPPASRALRTKQRRMQR